MMLEILWNTQKTKEHESKNLLVNSYKSTVNWYNYIVIGVLVALFNQKNW